MASDTNDPLSTIMQAQAQMVETVFGQWLPQAGLATEIPSPADLSDPGKLAGDLQARWQGFLSAMPGAVNFSAPVGPSQAGMEQWLAMVEGWMKMQPAMGQKALGQVSEDMSQLWQAMAASMAGGSDGAEMPRKDRRFADPAWQNNPFYALLHQSYLLAAERIEAMANDLDGVPAEKRSQLKFAAHAMIEALSPANFPATNPVVLKKTLESGGANLTKGMQHLAKDLERGQLTHTDPDAFELGRNIAVTPGKVVHETPLYQLIQYSPSTDEVYATPLIIFPPWINRFYILDLNEKKSFVRWAVAQGLTVFMVSWKSADESMRDVVWDDYIRAEMDAIDHVRARLDVPAVHTIGYCVAGTTLAATLAILHRREQQDKVTSATYFTAQVDFDSAGELLHFIDDGALAAIDAISGAGGGGPGYLDGRYMALTFNMLRGTDLIWNYVVNNYLLGEDYPAFDLLHWNGDVTNLPAKWHGAYLRDLYRDNKLATPDALSGDGTPIDLTLVETPTYVQAGREDHIAPAKSVWKIQDHFKGPLRFVLAGSGHIAGVVNPPEAGKYQYWLNEGAPATLEEFVEGAAEHKGSWWPDWIAWIDAQDSRKVKPTGKRKPGSRGDTVIEDAPGRYVMTR
ncbi:MAG: class I poly(R)-hydroxyalkanoic acid synthase [Alteripontixanthobacter sp.]